MSKDRIPLSDALKLRNLPTLKTIRKHVPFPKMTQKLMQERCESLKCPKKTSSGFTILRGFYGKEWTGFSVTPSACGIGLLEALTEDDKELLADTFLALGASDSEELIAFETLSGTIRGNATKYLRKTIDGVTAIERYPELRNAVILQAPEAQEYVSAVLAFMRKRKAELARKIADKIAAEALAS